jgi:hypothetical protein
MTFDRGADVWKLAQQLFPGGKDANPIDYYSFPLAIKQTYEWIISGELFRIESIHLQVLELQPIIKDRINENNRALSRK